MMTASQPSYDELVRRCQAAEAQLAAIQSSETASILESMSDAFFTLDDDLVVTYFNGAAARVLGRDVAAVLGQPLFDAFPEARGSIFEDRYREAILTRQPLHFETYFDVPPYCNWFEVRVYPHTQGIAVYFLVTTERKQAEDALRERHQSDKTALLHDLQVHQAELEAQNMELRATQEQLTAARDQYSDFYNFAPLGYLTLDATGCLIEVNLTFTHLLGDLGRRHLLGQKLTQYIARESQDAFHFFWLRLQQSTEAQTAELLLTKADGTTCWTRLDAIVTRTTHAGESSEPREYHLTVSDITRHKEAEAAQVFLLQCGLPGTREDFFVSLARYLAETLHIGYVCIDQLVGDGLTAHTVAIYHDGHFDSNVTYALKDTPCGQVVGETICCFPREVCQLFPNDADLLALQAESYIGTTLWDSHGQPIGLIALIDRQPLVQPQRAAALLQLVAPRAAGELERRQAEQELVAQTQRLGLAMRSGGLGIWDWNVVENRMIWDDRMIDMYGYTADTFPGGIEAWQQGLHPEDRDRAWEECQAALHGERIFDTEFRIQRPDGTTRYLKADGLVIHHADGTALRMLGINYDITERKEAEEQLRESEDRFRVLTTLAPVGIYLTSPDGECAYANPKWCEMAGLDLEDARGLGWARALHSDDRDIVFANWQQMVTSEGQWGHEYRFQTPDGRITWVYGIAAAQRNAAGDIIGYVGVNTDITARKQTEIALQESEARWRSYIDHAPYAVYLTDENGRYLQVNPEACRSTGYREDELLAMHIPDLLAPDSHAEGVAHFQRVRDTGYADGEVRFRLKSGELRWAYVAAVKLSATRYLGFAQDIHARKAAEEALREASQLNHHIITNAQEGVVVYDRDLRYRVWNPFMEHLSGIPAADVLGRHPLEVFPFLREVGVMERLERALADEPSTTIDFPFTVPATGRSGWTADTSGPLRNAEGEIIGVIATVQNITARKQAEEEREHLHAQLQQAQKLESIGRLAGGVAHDFNNMLGAIIGYTELAMQQLETPSPIHADLDEIKRAAERSADLTRQLLAFARKQTVAPKVVNLNDAITGMLKMLQRLIGEDIHLTWQPGADLGQIYLDPAQIDQILANLCVNARDAIHGVGTVTIATRNITLDDTYCDAHVEATPGAFVVLQVRDNGCGMDAETLAHLFEPFYTTKGVGEGTGLGLATVYGIVMQNGGFIQVASELGQGTTFHIYFPQYTETSTPPLANPVNSPNYRGTETVLLVEDEPAILGLATRVLEQHGYQVIAAHAPHEALRLIEEHGGAIHLLLTDVIMPEMNGRDLAERLQARYPYLQCVFMSGYTASVIAQHGVLESGVHFLQKPFSIHDLLVKVREVLDAATPPRPI